MVSIPSLCMKCLEAVTTRTRRRMRIVSVALAFVTTYLLFDRFYLDLAADNPNTRSLDNSSLATEEVSIPTAPPNIRIFYNLFAIGPDDEERVQQIVEEQFAHIDPGLHDANVSVTSIGHRLPSLPRNAHVEAHHDEGGEELTLRALWKYCKANENQHAKVVYLHSKGSYHPTQSNARLRDFVTRGALSSECSHLPNGGGSNGYECNVCSSRMSPLPHPHTSGNMWLARCSYISKLVDPLALKEGKLPNKMNEEDPCNGRGRYLGEHWVHSHPSVRPCDLYPGKEFTWAHLRVPALGSWEKQLMKAPRFKFSEYVLPGMCMDEHPETLKVEEFIELRRQNYELLYDTSELEEGWWGWGFLKQSIGA